MLVRRTVLGVGLALLLPACTSAGTGPSARPSPDAAATTPAREPTPAALASGRTSSAGPEGVSACTQVSPTSRTPDGQLEVRGTGRSDDIELWGLLFEEPPLRSGDEVKIAWRMTGAGDLALSVTRPDGSAGRLAWGPEAHSGSSYDRPGDEWGAGYSLDSPGCWTLHAARGDSRADVRLDVVA